MSSSAFFPVIATTDLAYEMPEKMSVMDTIVNIFPSNFISPMVESNMLQVIVIALLLGFSIIGLGEKNVGIVKACNSLNEVFMKCMEMILKLSPIGVFCLLCPVVASNGTAIIGSLAMVLLAAYICYVLHATIVYSIAVKTMGGISPTRFFKEMLPAIMFAFPVHLLWEHFQLIWSVWKNSVPEKRFHPLYFHLVQPSIWMEQRFIRESVRFLSHPAMVYI